MPNTAASSTVRNSNKYHHQGRSKSSSYYSSSPSSTTKPTSYNSYATSDSSSSSNSGGVQYHATTGGTSATSGKYRVTAQKILPKTAVITAHKRNSEDDRRSSSLALDCNEMTKMLEDGPLKFRILVLLGAIFMVVANIMDYNELQFNNYYGSSGVETLFFIISLYIWIFGAFIITLEMRPFRKGVSVFHRWILEQMSFLRFTWGRGLLYFFSGSLQMVLFTKWNMIAGGAMILLGIASVILGQLASKKLKSLVKKIGNRNNLLEKFKMHDKDHDGYLNVREFRYFVKDMNVKLSDDELNNAFMAIDRDVDRKITFQDLSNWYANAKFDVKTDGVII